MPSMNLSFLNRGKVREACRVCREIAELKTERLCGRCVWIKSQINARFAAAARERGHDFPGAAGLDFPE